MVVLWLAFFPADVDVLPEASALSLALYLMPLGSNCNVQRGCGWLRLRSGFQWNGGLASFMK